MTEGSNSMAIRRLPTKTEHQPRLPAEIVLEILSWLPLFSLLRLRLVSKQWRDLTGCRQFRDLHSRRSSLPPYPTPPSLLFSFSFEVPPLESRRRLFFHMSWPGSSTRHTIRLDPGDDLLRSFERSCVNDPDMHRLWVDLSDSPPMPCNGLLCIAPHFEYCRVAPAIVCNPLTLEYMTLPPAVDSMFCLYTALGFSPSSGVYKAVRITTTAQFNSRKRLMEVCTLGVDTSWRKTPIVLDYFDKSLSSKDVLYVDGKIYWILLWPEPIGRASMLIFDVDSEDAYLRDGVPGLGGDVLDSPMDSRLVQLRSNNLSLFIKRASHRAHQFSIQVWVLQERCGGECSWDLRHNVELPQLWSGYLSHKDADILALWESGDGGIHVMLSEATLYIDGQSMDLMMKSQLHSPPTKKRRCKSIGSGDKGCDRAFVMGWTPCHGYKPSLAPLPSQHAESIPSRFMLF